LRAFFPGALGLCLDLSPALCAIKIDAQNPLGEPLPKIAIEPVLQGCPFPGFRQQGNAPLNLPDGNQT
jgi:hypothetical protein